MFAPRNSACLMPIFPNLGGVRRLLISSVDRKSGFLAGPTKRNFAARTPLGAD
jgi:hypothetical protein